jgi:hypothetical protein
MAELLLLATLVVIAVLAPFLGADSRDPVRGNRGDHPTSPDPWWDMQRFLRH